MTIFFHFLLVALGSSLPLLISLWLEQFLPIEFSNESIQEMFVYIGVHIFMTLRLILFSLGFATAVLIINGCRARTIIWRAPLFFINLVLATIVAGIPFSLLVSLLSPIGASALSADSMFFLRLFFGGCSLAAYGYCLRELDLKKLDSANYLKLFMIGVLLWIPFSAVRQQPYNEFVDSIVSSSWYVIAGIALYSEGASPIARSSKENLISNSWILKVFGGGRAE